MRTLWNGLSFLAVVNLLAVLIFAGWLYRSGRLNGERVRTMREMLTTTIAEDEQRAAAETQSNLDASIAASVAERAQNPPLPGAAHAALRTQLRGVEHEAARRMAAERQRLRDDLVRWQSELEQREAAVTVRENAIDLTAVEQEQRDAEVQFRKVVKQYELASPKVAKEWAMTLIGQGEFDTAVRYLDAMDPRAAKKILNEFKTGEEPQLATQLLQSVALLGQADAIDPAVESPGP